jgi:hypothetical protein
MERCLVQKVSKNPSCQNLPLNAQNILDSAAARLLRLWGRISVGA